VLSFPKHEHRKITLHMLFSSLWGGLGILNAYGVVLDVHNEIDVFSARFEISNWAVTKENNIWRNSSSVENNCVVIILTL
jgi:hypothetical protein